MKNGYDEVMKILHRAVVLILSLTVFGCGKHSSESDTRTTITSKSPIARDVVLLAGFESDNVLAFDFDTATAQELVRFAPDTRPRGVAQNSKGDIFVSTRGGNMNVIRITFDNAQPIISDFTESIGRYGPAQLYIDAKDQLYVACDSTNEVRQYDHVGSLQKTYAGSSIGGNICAFTIHDQAIYTSHLFRSAIGQFSVDGDESLQPVVVNRGAFRRPFSIVASPNGNLLVGSYENDGRVLELDPNSGEVLGEFVNLESEGMVNTSAMAYHAKRGTYLFGTTSGLLEYRKDGKKHQRYDIDLVEDVAAISFARSILWDASPAAN